MPNHKRVTTRDFGKGGLGISVTIGGREYDDCRFHNASFGKLLFDDFDFVIFDDGIGQKLLAHFFDLGFSFSFFLVL